MRLLSALPIVVIVLETEAYALADEPAAAPSASTASSHDVDRSEVYLHVETTMPVVVENSATGEVVCASPCDKRVASAPRYRIAGVRPSPDFTLAAPTGRADLRVKAASKTTFWVGVAGMGVGAALLGSGIGVLVYGVENRAPVPGGDGEETDNRFTDLMTLGTSLAILGAVATLWGGATVVSNATSKVRGDLNTARSDAPRVTAASAGRALPKPMYVPLLQGSF